jgi:hypothetical protein
MKKAREWCSVPRNVTDMREKERTPEGGYVVRCTPGFAHCIALKPVAMTAPRMVWLNGAPFKPSEMPL